MSLEKVLIYKNRAQLDDNMTYSQVSAVANTYTLDTQNHLNKTFAIETTDTNAKTIAFANVASTAGTINTILIRLKYTSAAAITYPTVTWQNAIVPTFAAGKRYYILFTNLNLGDGWIASSIGAW